MALWIEVIPPLVAALQVACEPCHDGVMPEYTLVIICHKVVFSFHLDELNGLAQYLQSIEELYALADGYVGVYGAMEKEQRSVDLVGIEE